MHVLFNCPYEDGQLVINAPSLSMNIEIYIYILQFAITIIDTKTM
jgi:hypothetical protein